MSDRCAFWSAAGLSLAVCLFVLAAHLIGRLAWPAPPPPAARPARGVLVLVNPDFSSAAVACPADPVALAAVRQYHDGAEAVQMRACRCRKAAENGTTVIRVAFLLFDRHGIRRPFSICFLLRDEKLLAAW
jgi:hypothetical protein